MALQEFFSLAFKVIGVGFAIAALASPFFFRASVTEFNRTKLIGYILMGLTMLSIAISELFIKPELRLTIICFIPIISLFLLAGYYIETHIFTYTSRERGKRRENLKSFFDFFKMRK